MKGSNRLLGKILLHGGKKSRLIVALTALGTGLTLLLLAVLLWWNFNELLHGTRNDDSLGSTFLTISKKVTSEAVGHPERTVFSQTEFSALQSAPEVQAVGPVIAVKPKVWLSMDMGANTFSTILVLEAVPESFMDKKPADWDWHPGQVQVPIILSSSFLSLYNYAFAPSQGLPQLSEDMIKALPFKMNVALPSGPVTYIGHVVGFSDRITSVLAPEAFVSSVNAADAGSGTAPLSRIIIKVKDPSKKEFTTYLESHGYSTNSEQLRLSKLRAIVETIAGSVGILALLLLGVSSILFILFIELTIARAEPSLQRLLEQGYSPKQLGGFLVGKFLPLLFMVSLGAVVLCVAAQLGAQYIAKDQQLNLATLPGWPVWMVAAISILLLLLIMRRAIHRSVSRVG